MLFEPEDFEPEPFDESAHAVSLDDEAGSRIDRIQTHDRHGRPIKSSRYMRRYYGARVEITLACACGETFSGSGESETTGSSMESLI